MEKFESFRGQRTVVMTTFRANGTPVPTPVSIAVEDDPTRAYVRSWAAAGKAKRIRNNSYVTVAPSTFGGTTTGPAVGASARRLSGPEEERARRLLRRKHPILHGLLIPFVHKLQRNTTCHFALTPSSGG